MAKISRTWWGQRFIQALETFMEEGRLKRGRSYSQPHRILAFDIQDKNITATVRGNVNPYFGVYKEPKYKIKIQLTQFSQEKWKKVIEQISNHAGWISKLLLNEIPGTIEDAFESVNLHLLPQSEEDLKTTCSCPDWCNPCKHIAGVYYKVASLLDHNPFLLFQLRGLSKEALQQQLQKSPLGKALASHLTLPSDIAPEPVASYYTTPDTCIPDDEISLKAYWCGNSLMPDEINEEATQVPAVLIKKQGDYPPFWDRDNSFIETMETIYSFVKKKNYGSL